MFVDWVAYVLALTATFQMSLYKECYSFKQLNMKMTKRTKITPEGGPRILPVHFSVTLGHITIGTYGASHLFSLFLAPKSLSEDQACNSTFRPGSDRTSPHFQVRLGPSASWGNRASTLVLEFGVSTKFDAHIEHLPHY